jgi:hypothetical protein
MVYSGYSLDLSNDCRSCLCLVADGALDMSARIREPDTVEQRFRLGCFSNYSCDTVELVSRPKPISNCFTDRLELAQSAKEKEFDKSCCIGGNERCTIFFGSHDLAVNAEETHDDKRKSNQ